MEELFRRLGLSAEYKKTNLETGKPEVKQLMERVVKDINGLNWEEAQEKLTQVREKVSLKNRFNMQTIMNEEMYLAWNREQITVEEYRIRMQGTLELTVPFEIFLKDGPKYLSHMEQTCIQNLMQGMEDRSADLLTCIQRFQEYYKPYEEGKKLQSVFRMYEFIMNLVASRLGNIGEYEAAERLDKIVIEGCLRYHRLLALPSALYDRLWNDVSQKKQGIPLRRQVDKVEVMDQIIALSRLGKQAARVQFFLKKREEFLQERN